jgi:methylase of polypeptide subunit release factors
MREAPAAWIGWTDEAGRPQRRRWRSLGANPPPSQVVLADERMPAATALRLARAGTGLLWCGDYHRARALLAALARALPAPVVSDDAPLAERFAAMRAAQAGRSRVLGMLLLPFDADHGVPLRRAPDVRAAGAQARGRVDEPYVASLRELLGLIGAYEWRRVGVPVAALGARIHPHYGVFSPVRGEYVDLVARAPLPAAARTDGAFDVGTGTGVLAAVLARRGLRVVATDIDPRALACARDNLARLGLGLAGAVKVERADLFAPGRAGLVVCNPPWVPADPGTALDAAVYDPGSRMLRGFLAGLGAHLVSGGEGWLILSDLAERLGLRSRATLLRWIAAAGLRVVGRDDTRPQHRKAGDPGDPLHAARRAEVTSLWRLAADHATDAGSARRSRDTRRQRRSPG